jgi:hypothetical protein
MAMSGNYNLVIECGADFSLTFVLKNNGEVYDLTDWVFAAQMRNAPGETVLADFDTQISADGERMTIALDYETTAALDEGHFKWDLFALRPDGVRMRLLEGNVTVVERITNAVP